ncbi:MAG: TetR/AcrR family transcriptional regulator [Thermomicrobiales bacterium]|nr:TetR/AcrR family transcriptional regulator [Thermomicrobiales bacterium]
MNTSPQTLTAAQLRTRTAILRVALSMLINDRSASMSDVAKEADVARSTLHRYFPERSDLIDAVDAFASHQLAEILDHARINEGNAADALVRIAHGYFAQWDVVMWNFVEITVGASSRQSSEVDAQLLALVERGQAEGSIDHSIPGAFIRYTIYTLVDAASEYARNHHRSEAAMLMDVTLRKLIAP